MTNTIEVQCLDQKIELNLDQLKGSELINTYVNDLIGEEEPIELPCQSECLLQFINRQNKGLSVLPEHYDIADFLNYDYTPALWTPYEWKDFLNQEKTICEEKDKIIEEICLYIKENATIENYKDKKMFRCQFNVDITQRLKDQYVKTQVCKHLQTVTTKKIRIFTQYDHQTRTTKARIATSI